MGKHTFLSDLLRVLFSKTLIIILGIGSSVISARYLGPERSGYIVALSVYPSLFMTFGALGIRQSVTYFLGRNLYSEARLKRAIVQIWFFTTSISLVVCFLLMRYFSNSGDNLAWVILALLPIPFTLFNTYNSGIFLGKNQIAAFNRINWIPPLVSFSVAALLVIGLSWGVQGYLIASFMGVIVMSLIMLFKNRFIQAFSLSFDWPIIKELLRLGVIYAISLLIINLNYKIDIILLDKLSDQYEIGIYSKGSNIIQYLWNIPMMLSTIIFARSAAAKDGLMFSKKVAQLLRLSVLLIGAAAVVMSLMSRIIIVGLFGPNFEGSIIILQLLAPGVVLLTIFKVMNMDLAGKGKPWVALKAMVPALVINVLLNFWLIPILGAKGAALASTISYSLASILFLYFYSSETKLRLTEIISYKKTDFDPIIKLLNRKSIGS